MAATVPSDTDKPYRGRRLSWREFYAMRPDLRPDNDNDDVREAEQSAIISWIRPRLRLSNSRQALGANVTC